MALYRVTIAHTCFTSYLVEAPSEEAAKELKGAAPKLWKESDGWGDEGYGDDPIVLSVDEQR